jgi:hypothetical protein
MRSAPVLSHKKCQYVLANEGSDDSLCYNEVEKKYIHREFRVMAHYNTILHQIIALIPRHVFDRQAALHHSGQKFRSYNRWSQFMAMLIGQLSGRRSLRDIIDNLKARRRCLHHLGMKENSRSTLARGNRGQPASLYEAIFNHLLKQCRAFAPGCKFFFKNKVHLLDETVINLCLALFPWAECQKKERSREAAYGH